MIRALIDKKKLSMLELFMRNPDTLFHLKKISEDADVPISSAHRILKVFLQAKILTITKVRKMKLYSLDRRKAAVLKRCFRMEKGSG